MRRRSALATAGSALGALLAGCVSEPASSDGDGGDDSGEDGGARTDAGVHHLYLVNLDDRSRRVDLAVVRGDGETVIEGTYEIPHERGGEFREVAAWGETYEVTATLASGVSETFGWVIERCPGPEAGDDEAELPDGSRNGGVRIEPGGEELSFVTDRCDEIVAGTAVPTGGADRFEVEED